MRNVLTVMVLFGAMWMSFSQAQSRLDDLTPLPADKGRGEAKTELMISFRKPLLIPASALNGRPLNEIYAETRGRFSFSGGRWITGLEGEKLAKASTATVCTIGFVSDFTKGAITTGGAEFQDLTINGDLAVNDVFYTSSWSMNSNNGKKAISASVNATIPLVSTDFHWRRPTPAQISVERTYIGGDASQQELNRALSVTPASLRDCFGEGVEVFEVPAKH